MAEAHKLWTPRVVTDEDIALNLGQSYERQLVCALCDNPQLWALIGLHLQTHWLKDPAAKTLFEAARAVAKGTGTGPTSISAVTKQLRFAHVDKGKLTEAEYVAATNILVEHDPSTAPSVSEFAEQVGYAIRDKLKGELIDGLLVARGKNPDVDTGKFQRRLSEIELIGRSLQTYQVDSVFDESVWQRIDSLQRTSKLPLGIPELDAELDGGIYRQSLFVYGAESNVGKSHLILNTALNAANLGYRVLYIPTEQSVPANLVRSIAWMTNCTTSDVVAQTEQVKYRWAEAMRRPHGPIEFAFLPKGGTPSQLRALIKQILDNTPQLGGGFDVLALDIADRMKGDGKDYKGTYDSMGDVYEDLANLAKEINGWVFTGSQIKDRQGRKGPPTHEDLADSKHKGRIADAVVTAWCDPDSPDLRGYYISKARDQKVGSIVGPLPTALDRGQIYPRFS